MRRAGRKDAVQRQVVDALRSIGVVVRVVNQEGLPDLLTWHRTTNWLPIEVKVPGKKLTQQQAHLRDVAPFPIVHGPEEALLLFGVTLELPRRPS